MRAPVLFWTTVVLASLTPPQVSAQPERPDEAFSVASIRGNTSGDRATTYRLPAASQLLVTNMPLFEILRLAYQTQPDQLVDAPGWIKSERYDIVAKAPEGVNMTPRTFPPMLRRLLEDRFRLTVHRESRSMSRYRLIRVRQDGKLGDQIQPSNLDCDSPTPGGAPAKSSALPQTNKFGTPPCIVAVNNGRLGISGLPFATFVTWLAPLVDRVIVDDTGLTGAWDIDLSYTRPGVESTSASDPPSVFTAVQEQLGLKLEGGTGPVDVLVIDKISRPTEN